MNFIEKLDFDHGSRAAKLSFIRKLDSKTGELIRLYACGASLRECKGFGEPMLNPPELISADDPRAHTEFASIRRSDPDFFERIVSEQKEAFRAAFESTKPA
ncbi:hypothetical protein [Burkholderia sp. Cy-637]|uniref:hypothetical protein n=1 Tax=Burkholderia sp. Cy-637 TaxID=2608327 RepID=UPI00141F0A15|nr:hypothetical protein [Burkholderia sp. Cy-637]NIF88867.1 hypothetical protein [Burkholderia sp. Cy-637]